MTDPSEDRTIRIPREKLVGYKADGQVDCVRWFRHELGFSVEFHINNTPKELCEDSALNLWARDVDVEGVGRIWITDCPGGVELHDRSPRSRRGAERGPDHEHCIALRGPCWHDGSSMAASEFCRAWIGTDEEVWRLLDRWVGYEMENREDALLEEHP